MTPTRAAAYTIVGTLLVAWFASAVGVTRQPRNVRRPPVPTDAARLDALATDVQSQASRLRQRLASAPAPQTPIRNPFVFASREMPRARVIERPAPVVMEPEPAPVEPSLVLIGVAESASAAGSERTAMIADEAEQLHMVKVGQQLIGRYDVVAVGADAVELKDTVTGTTRRLLLK